MLKLANRLPSTRGDAVICRASHPCARLIKRRDELSRALNEQIAQAKAVEERATSFVDVAVAWDAVEEVSARLAQITWKLDECMKDVDYTDEREQELGQRMYDI
jgi:hypothetical protein